MDINIYAYSKNGEQISKATIEDTDCERYLKYLDTDAGKSAILDGLVANGDMKAAQAVEYSLISIDGGKESESSFSRIKEKK